MGLPSMLSWFEIKTAPLISNQLQLKRLSSKTMSSYMTSSVLFNQMPPKWPLVQRKREFQLWPCHSAWNGLCTTISSLWPTSSATAKWAQLCPITCACSALAPNFTIFSRFLHFGASFSSRLADVALRLGPYNSILALVIFLLKSFKKCFKIVFFSALASRSGFGAQFPMPLPVVLLWFATQSPQIALEWLRQGCFLLWLHA